MLYAVSRSDTVSVKVDSKKWQCFLTLVQIHPTEDDMSGGNPLWFSEGCHWTNPHGRARPARRPCDGPSLALATQTGVKLGTVVKTRARSNAPVCFDDGGGWSERQTDALHPEPDSSREDGSSAAEH